MPVSRVDYDGKTLIDLTGDTVTEDTLAYGVIAHDAAGNAITGAMIPNLYATCSTAAATAAKVATTTSGKFALITGAMVRVKFTNANTYNGIATLNIDGTGAKNITRVGTTTTTRYFWSAGEVVDFVYDGTNFVMVRTGIATTTYYGLTKLATSAVSTSASTALTPASLNNLAQYMLSGVGVYSAAATYAVGDRVRYGYYIYECIVAITTAEAWNAEHWKFLDPLQVQIDVLAAKIESLMSHMHSITYNLTQVISSNNTAVVSSGNAYTATLAAEDGYGITSVAITMGGVDVTSTVYNSGVINISAVTGDVVITATAIRLDTVADFAILNGTSVGATVTEENGVFKIKAAAGVTGWYNSYTDVTVGGLTVGKKYNFVVDTTGLTYNASAKLTTGHCILYDAQNNTLVTKTCDATAKLHTFEFTATTTTVRLRWYPANNSYFQAGTSVGMINCAYINREGTTAHTAVIS